MCAGSRELAEAQSSITSGSIFPSFQHLGFFYCKSEGLVANTEESCNSEGGCKKHQSFLTEGSWQEDLAWPSEWLPQPST